MSIVAAPEESRAAQSLSVRRNMADAGPAMRHVGERGGGVLGKKMDEIRDGARDRGRGRPAGRRSGVAFRRECSQASAGGEQHSLVSPRIVEVIANGIRRLKEVAGVELALTVHFRRSDAWKEPKPRCGACSSRIGLHPSHPTARYDRTGMLWSSRAGGSSLPANRGPLLGILALRQSDPRRDPGCTRTGRCRVH